MAWLATAAGVQAAAPEQGVASGGGQGSRSGKARTLGLKQLPPVPVTHIVSRFLGLEGVVGQLPHPIANEVEGGPQSTGPLVSGLGLSRRPHLSPRVWPARPLWPVRTLPSTGEGQPAASQAAVSGSLASLALSPGDFCGAQDAPSTCGLPKSTTVQLGSWPRGDRERSWSLVPVRPVACPAWAPGAPMPEPQGNRWPGVASWVCRSQGIW